MRIHQQIRLGLTGTACLTILCGCITSQRGPQLNASPAPLLSVSQRAAVLACDSALLKLLGRQATHIQAQPPDRVESVLLSTTIQPADSAPRYHVLGSATVTTAAGGTIVRKYSCTTEQRPTRDIKIDTFQLLTP